MEQERATTYLNGGVGDDEAQYMCKTTNDYLLRLTFLESKDNEFVANVGLLETREVTLDGKSGRDVNFHWTASAQ